MGGSAGGIKDVVSWVTTTSKLSRSELATLTHRCGGTELVSKYARSVV